MRKLRPFHYVQPRLMEEALLLLARHGTGARVIAGGTDLLLMMKNGEIAPTHLVDIKGLPQLDSVTVEGETVTIGALTRLTTLAQSSFPESLAVIGQAAETVGSYQIRNRATLGGNICNASPSADTVPALLCLDASVAIRSEKGTRSVPLAQFFTGPGATVLGPHEVLSHITLTRPDGRTRAVYLRHSVRNALDLAIVGVAVKIDGAGQDAAAVRIALGGVAPTPLRAKRTEAFLAREGIRAKTMHEALEILAGELSPISDVRASAEYRIAMAQVLVRRALESCVPGLKRSGQEVGR